MLTENERRAVGGKGEWREGGSRKVSREGHKRDGLVYSGGESRVGRVAMVKRDTESYEKEE